MDGAVEKRMQAQNAKRHMEEKHAKEKKEVDVAQEAVEILETEFKVWFDQIPKCYCRYADWLCNSRM